MGRVYSYVCHLYRPEASKFKRRNMTTGMKRDWRHRRAKYRGSTPKTNNQIPIDMRPKKNCYATIEYASTIDPPINVL